MEPRQPSLPMAPSFQAAPSARAVRPATTAPLATTALLASNTEPLPALVIDGGFRTVDTPSLQGILILRDNRTCLVPNLTIIVGWDVALVMDTGLGPSTGARNVALARGLATRRREGSAVPTQVAAAAAAAGTVPTVPKATYDGPHACVDLAGRTALLTAMGTPPARGDTTIHLPHVTILLAGDLIKERMFPPDDTDVDDAPWTDASRGFARQRPTLSVPGSRKPGRCPHRARSSRSNRGNATDRGRPAPHRSVQERDAARSGADPRRCPPRLGPSRFANWADHLVDGFVGATKRDLA